MLDNGLWILFLMCVISKSPHELKLRIVLSSMFLAIHLIISASFIVGYHQMRREKIYDLQVAQNKCEEFGRKRKSNLIENYECSEPDRQISSKQPSEAKTPEATIPDARISNATDASVYESVSEFYMEMHTPRSSMTVIILPDRIPPGYMEMSPITKNLVQDMGKLKTLDDIEESCIKNDDDDDDDEPIGKS